MSSLAQDELGHAAALYGLLGELTGRDPDALAYDREPAELPPLPAARPRPRRLGDDDRPALPVRHAPTRSGSRRWPAASWAPLAELVGKLVREERYHRMHADAWLDRLAAAGGEPRDRLLRGARRRSAPDAATVFTPLPGEPALVEAGILAAPMRRARGALARGDRARRFARLDLPMPPAGPRAGRRPARTTATPSAGCGASSRSVRASRPGGDLVSEAGTQVGVARARAGAVIGPASAAAGRRGRRPRGPRRGHGPGAPDGLDRRPRDRPARRGRRRTARSASSSCRRSSAARRSS